MKLFVVILSIFAVVNSEFVVNTGKDLARYRDECVAELGIPAETVELYKKWSYPNDPLTHCYVKCALTKMNLFKDEPLIANLVLQLGRGEVLEGLREKVEKCVDNSGDDKCLWAYRGFGCLIKNEGELVRASLS